MGCGFQVPQTVHQVNGDGSIHARLFDVHHAADELGALADYIKDTCEPATILMETTSHYHYTLLKALSDLLNRISNRDIS